VAGGGRNKWRKSMGPIGSTLSFADKMRLRIEIQRAFEKCQRNCIGPSLIDHHRILTHGRPHDLYNPWFNERFPKTVNAMKSKSTSMISNSICKSNPADIAVDNFLVEQIRPGHDDSDQWIDSVFVPEPENTGEVGFGDPLQTPYEATQTWEAILGW